MPGDRARERPRGSCRDHIVSIGHDVLDTYGHVPLPPYIARQTA